MRVAWHVHGTLEHVHGMCIEAHCMFLSQGGGDSAPAHRRSSQLCQRAQLAQLRGRPAGRARHVHQRQECQNQKVTVARPPARVPQWPIECRGAARGTAMHSLLTHTHLAGTHIGFMAACASFPGVHVQFDRFTSKITLISKTKCTPTPNSK